MDLGIGGKVALVTGATKGIGLGIAQALAREGARVSVVARTESDVQRVAAEIKGFGVAADVTTEPGCKRSVEQTQANLGPIEILYLFRKNNEPRPIFVRRDCTNEKGNISQAGQGQARGLVQGKGQESVLQSKGAC